MQINNIKWIVFLVPGLIVFTQSAYSSPPMSCKNIFLKSTNEKKPDSIVNKIKKLFYPNSNESRAQSNAPLNQIRLTKQNSTPVIKKTVDPHIAQIIQSYKEFDFFTKEAKFEKENKYRDFLISLPKDKVNEIEIYLMKLKKSEVSTKRPNSESNEIEILFEVLSDFSRVSDDYRISNEVVLHLADIFLDSSPSTNAHELGTIKIRLLHEIFQKEYLLEPFSELLLKKGESSRQNIFGQISNLIKLHAFRYYSGSEFLNFFNLISKSNYHFAEIMLVKVIVSSLEVAKHKEGEPNESMNSLLMSANAIEKYLENYPKSDFQPKLIKNIGLNTLKSIIEDLRTYHRSSDLNIALRNLINIIKGNYVKEDAESESIARSHNIDKSLIKELLLAINTITSPEFAGLNQTELLKAEENYFVARVGRMQTFSNSYGKYISVAERFESAKNLLRKKIENTKELWIEFESQGENTNAPYEHLRNKSIALVTDEIDITTDSSKQSLSVVVESGFVTDIKIINPKESSPFWVASITKADGTKNTVNLSSSALIYFFNGP